MAYSDEIIAARKSLLDAAEVLGEHLESLVLVGAQAIYLYTGDADVPIATTTRDSDMAIDPGPLASEPAIQEVLEDAGYALKHEDLKGQWINPQGVQVDLLTPTGLQAEEFRDNRGARIPPHADYVARNTVGVEGIVIDTQIKEVGSLDPQDSRSISMRVAGPSTLVVAKAFKICERLEERKREKRDRTKAKDAHDLYRLLQSVNPEAVVAGFQRQLTDERTRPTALKALEYLDRYGIEVTLPIPELAGAAEGILGNPDRTAQQTAFLIGELLDEVVPQG